MEGDGRRRKAVQVDGRRWKAVEASHLLLADQHAVGDLLLEEELAQLEHRTKDDARVDAPAAQRTAQARSTVMSTLRVLSNR